MKKVSLRICVFLSIITLNLNPVVAQAELPVVPVPEENPITESKRVLGKILFWDEQLSSDDTVAAISLPREVRTHASPLTLVQMVPSERMMT